MPSAIGFDNEKYLREQSAAIMERVARADNKLYLEFGGKLLFDYHAARVLPGYDPNVKMMLLQQIRDTSEVILCIYAGDIDRPLTMDEAAHFESTPFYDENAVSAKALVILFNRPSLSAQSTKKPINPARRAEAGKPTKII